MLEIISMWAVCILLAIVIVKTFYILRGSAHKGEEVRQPLKKTQADDNILRIHQNTNIVSSDEESRYRPVQFNNLVIRSGRNTTYTEIDSVIVSPYGIFCIEKKAHVGYIFGSKDKEYWTQCKYNEKVKLFNPLRQNYKHVQALNSLFGKQLKVPIHSYVFFSKAKIVQVDSNDVFSDWNALEKKINNHTRAVYSLDEYKEILRTLAIASSGSKELLPVHIAEVNAYLKQKVLA